MTDHGLTEGDPHVLFELPVPAGQYVVSVTAGRMNWRRAKRLCKRRISWFHRNGSNKSLHTFRRVNREWASSWQQMLTQTRA